MELAVGTKFTFQGKTYIVSDDHQACYYCDLDQGRCLAAGYRDVTGSCNMLQRTDQKNIVFKEINDMPRSKTITNKEDMKYTNTTDTVIINPPYKYDDEGNLKDVIIKCPSGFEVDVENSDLKEGIIKFKQKHLTLSDVYEHQGKDTYIANIVNNNSNTFTKIEAIAYFMDIAKFYNGDWDYNSKIENSEGYYILWDNVRNDYIINYISSNINFYSACLVLRNNKDARAIINNPNFRRILDTIYKAK